MQNAVRKRVQISRRVQTELRQKKTRDANERLNSYGQSGARAGASSARSALYFQPHMKAQDK